MKSASASVLSRELTLEDLETQLPYSGAELRDALELLKIPDGLEAYLDEEAARQEQERPQVMTFVVDDAEPVERPIEAAQKAGGKTRGGASLIIAQSYLETGRGER